MQKRILWKSDLWLLTVFFGTVALFLATMAVIHLVNRDYGEAFADALIVLVPLALALFCAFTDRAEAMQREKNFAEKPPPQPLPAAKALPDRRNLL